MDSRELISGWLAGSAGQIVGHPLDTLKVRMQTDAGGIRDAGLMQALRRTLSEGGPQGLFRGLAAPLVAKSVEQMLAFGVRGAADRGLEALGVTKGPRAALAGAAAGAATAVTLTPVYLIKVQLQVTKRSELWSPWRAACRAAAKGPLGLYAGATPMLLGTTLGYSCRFACYGKAVELVQAQGASESTAYILGGGVAGMATWASHYPLDLLSARMQARAAETERPRLSMLGHCREIWVEQGPRGFFRGLGPCLLRAFPVNAVIFFTYEAVSKYEY